MNNEMGLNSSSSSDDDDTLVINPPGQSIHLLTED